MKGAPPVPYFNFFSLWPVSTEHAFGYQLYLMRAWAFPVHLFLPSNSVSLSSKESNSSFLDPHG